MLFDEAIMPDKPTTTLAVSADAFKILPDGKIVVEDDQLRKFIDAKKKDSFSVELVMDIWAEPVPQIPPSA